MVHNAYVWSGDGWFVPSAGGHFICIISQRSYCCLYAVCCEMFVGFIVWTQCESNVITNRTLLCGMRCSTACTCFVRWEPVLRQLLSALPAVHCTLIVSGFYEHCIHICLLVVWFLAVDAQSLNTPKYASIVCTEFTSKIRSVITNWLPNHETLLHKVSTVCTLLNLYLWKPRFR